MSKYKFEVNPITGKLDLVPINPVLSFKEGVTLVGDLPLEGNQENDAIIVSENHRLHVWDGSAWQDQGDIFDLHWGAIEGAPSTTPNQIDEMFSLKHDKDKDQYLDYGGVNQIGANQVTKKSLAGIAYYVNCDTGSDNNPGTSLLPFQTIAKAVSQIPDYLNNNLYNIFLQSSQNYNESVIISGKVGGSISIQGQGLPLIQSSSNHVFLISSSSFISIRNLNTRINKNSRSCIYADKNSSVYVETCKVGDNGNTNTSGITSKDNSTVIALSILDLDENKVTTGLSSTYGGRILANDCSLGDTYYNVSVYGIIFDKGIYIKAEDYEDAITKKHPQNEDSTLITTPGTIIDVEQTLFKEDEFYPLGIPIAQTYVALRNGDVSKISVIVQPSGTPDAPIILELRTVDGEGKPTATVLGSVFKNYGDLVAPNNYTDFVFAAPIAIIKDTKYAIVLRTEATVGGYEFRFKLGEPYGEWYDFNDPDWILDEDLSLTFKVYLDVIQADLINEGTLKQDLFVDNGTKIDGRDISEDGTKLDTIEENAVSLNTVKTDETIRDVIYEAGYNEGMLSEPIITDNADGTIQVSSIDVLIRSTADFSGGRLYKKIVPAITDLAVAEGLNYIYVDYATGNPIYKATAIRGLINNSNTILIARIMERSNVVEYKVNYNASALSLSTKSFDKQLLMRGSEGIEKESGFGISETPTRVVNVGSGFLWFGLKRTELGAIAQGGGGVISDLWYHSGGVWIKSTITAYDNTQYDNGTNLVELTANRYAVNWIFRNIATNEIDIVLGRGDYTLPQAVASTVPPLPDDVAYFYLLIGRIIVQKGSNAATAIETIELDKMTATIVSEHNDLSGLNVGDYQHLTAAEKTKFDTPYAQTLIVAKSGGDYTTITAALAAIVDAATDKRYCIKVMPGTYVENITMKDYVDLVSVGGMESTIITAASGVALTLSEVDYSVIRGFTIQNTVSIDDNVIVYGNGSNIIIQDCWVEQKYNTSSNKCISNSGNGGTDIRIINCVLKGNANKTTTAIRWGGGTAIDSRVYFENVEIFNCSIGILYYPDGASALASVITFRNCHITATTSCIVAELYTNDKFGVINSYDNVYDTGNINLDSQAATRSIIFNSYGDAIVSVVKDGGGGIETFNSYGSIIGGNFIRSSQATITAGTTQSQGQVPLTKDINEVSVCANANDVVTLPIAEAGKSVVIFNNGTETLQIFPASGDDLGGGANVSTTLAATKNARFIAYNDTNWEVELMN